MDFSKEFTKYRIVYGSVQSETPTVINCFDNNLILAAMITFYPDSEPIPHDTVFVSNTPVFTYLIINFHRKEFPVIHQLLLHERPLQVSCTFENFGAIGSFAANKAAITSTPEPIGEEEP